MPLATPISARLLLYQRSWSICRPDPDRQRRRESAESVADLARPLVERKPAVVDVVLGKVVLVERWYAARGGAVVARGLAGRVLSVAGGEADDPLRDEQGGVATGKQPFKEVCRAKIGRAPGMTS